MLSAEAAPRPAVIAPDTDPSHGSSSDSCDAESLVGASPGGVFGLHVSQSTVELIVAGLAKTDTSRRCPGRTRGRERGGERKEGRERERATQTRVLLKHTCKSMLLLSLPKPDTIFIGFVNIDKYM